MLPTIQVLYVGDDSGSANTFVANCAASIHAPFLISLSLKVSDVLMKQTRNLAHGNQFPSLRYLTIVDIGSESQGSTT